jgi:hypothetical protein
MYIKETRCKCIDRIRLVQDRVQWEDLLNTVTNHRVPQRAGKFFDNLSNKRILTKDPAAWN